MNKTFEVDEPIVTALPDLKVARMPQTVFWAPYYDNDCLPSNLGVYLPQLPQGRAVQVACVFYDEETARQFQDHVIDNNPGCKTAEPSPRPVTMRHAMMGAIASRVLGVAVIVYDPANEAWVAERFLYVGDPLPSEFQ